MIATAQKHLIVPESFSAGRKVVERFPNPFARIVKMRKSRSQRRYYGKVWRPPKDIAHQQAMLAPGRPMGRPHGTHIGDMVELRKVILLCWRCTPHFHYKKGKYYKDEVFTHTTGRCDACKSFEPRAQAYYPEELLAEPGGMLRPGQILTPR